MVFGEEYSRIYDFIYFDKDYEKECNFLKDFLIGDSVLDMGCGTGGHAIILSKWGYSVWGVDRSKKMLEIAKRKAEEEKININFIEGDVRYIKINRKFSSVISMFAVLSYQIDNHSIFRFLRNVYEHLEDGGVFAFDCWNGLAVLTQKPQPKIKEVDFENLKIIRFTEPKIDYLNHIVEVNFTVFVSNGKNFKIFREKHLMRFIFPQEIKFFLETVGFSEIEIYPFLEKRNLTQDDWNMFVVAKK